MDSVFMGTGLVFWIGSSNIQDFSFIKKFAVEAQCFFIFLVHGFGLA